MSVIFADITMTLDGFVAAGLLDELNIHIAPIFLGDGTRPFDGPDLEKVTIEPVRTVASPNVTHLRYRVMR